MDDFKVDEPRAAGLLIENNIFHPGVAVGPRPAKLIAPELMSTPQFMRRCFQHLPRERAPVEVLPQALSRQLIDANGVRARYEGMKPIAVEHFKTLHFPASPVFDLGPETDRDAGHAKIQIRQISQLFAVSVPTLNHHSSSMTDPLGN